MRFCPRATLPAPLPLPPARGRPRHGAAACWHTTACAARRGSAPRRPPWRQLPVLRAPRRTFRRRSPRPAGACGAPLRHTTEWWDTTAHVVRHGSAQRRNCQGLWASCRTHRNRSRHLGGQAAHPRGAQQCDDTPMPRGISGVAALAKYAPECTLWSVTGSGV